MTNPDRTTTPSRFAHACAYRVEATMTGGAGASVRWTGARWTITEPPGVGVPPFRYTGTLSGTEVGTAFGGVAVTPASPRTALLTTQVTFPAGPEPRGAVGAHRARWELDYEAGGQAGTAAYDVQCTPMVVDAVLGLRDARTGGGGPFAEVMIGETVWQSDETGVARPRLAVGEYAYAVQPTRYAPSAGTLLVDNNQRTITVTRRAPEVEPGGFDAPCDSLGSCVPRVTVYDPAGAAGLPDQLAMGVGQAPLPRTSTTSEVLDAHRRRYTFGAGVYWPGTSVRFEVANAAGVRTRYVCERLAAWRCRETPP